MIGRIQGQLVEVSENIILIDVSGVCYEVEVTATALGRLPPRGSPLTLYTHFVVREDAQLLYGFASRDERDLFRGLIRINGVGPKLALNLISSVTLGVLAEAVANGDATPLTRVPGVGRKTAERLLVELKDRLDGLVVPEVPERQVGGATVEAERALVALGYKPQDAARAIAGVRGAGTSTEELVRAALRQIAQRGEAVL
jgi:Holliday junction DNA helicase RuvA